MTVGAVKRLAILVAAGSILSGCATLQEAPHEDVLATVTRACLAQNKQFTDAWGCVQSKDLLDQTGPDPDRRKRFMKIGDDLASQAAAKKLTSAEAKRRLEVALSAGEVD